MPKAYWVICHRSTNSAEKFAAFSRLAYPAIQAAGGRFLVRTSKVAKTYEHGLNDRMVVIEFENLALADGAERTCASSKASGRSAKKGLPRRAYRAQSVGA